MQNLKLTSKEQHIFFILTDFVIKQNLNVTLRVAGGWVRDKLLGIKTSDIDIAVEGMSGQHFATLLSDTWISTQQSRPHVSTIKANPEKSKHLETSMIHILGQAIDFVELRKESYNDNSRIPVINTESVSVKDDAKRRDFTINALFYNLHTKKIEDYVGGVADLENHILQTPLDPRITFLQDPLRILRGIRFAAKYNLRVVSSIILAANDKDVQKAFREKLSCERIWKELAGVQEAEEFKKGFIIGANPYYAGKLMQILGIRDLLFTLNDSERNLLGVKQDETSHWDMDQNSIHHNLSVWEHTLEALNQLKCLTYNKNINENDQIVIFLSMLLHDIGKCDLCSRQNKEDGTFSYKGHEVTSAKIAQYILDEKLKAPKEITSRVVRLITHHMRLHVLENNPSNTSLRRVIRDMDGDWQFLVYHSIADSLGKMNAKKDSKYLEMFERMLELQKNQGGNKIKRPIDGHIIMKELGIKPGPSIKKINEALDEKLLENPDMTSEDAIKFIKTINLSI